MGNLLEENELGLGNHDHINNRNMLGNTVRDLGPMMNSIALPSLCSFTNYDGL